MIFVDTFNFKEELKSDIRNWSPDGPSLRGRVMELCKKHRIPIKAEMFALQIEKLWKAKNPERACKLVDVIDDRCLAGWVRPFLAFAAVGCFIAWKIWISG